MEGSSIFKMPEGKIDKKNQIPAHSESLTLMLFINPNTPWNRGDLPYLKDIQHTDKLFFGNQNTTNDVTSKSKSRRSLSLSPLLSCVHGNVFNLVTKRCCFASSTLARPLPECVCACSICVPVSACVCVCAHCIAAVSFWVAYG